MRPEEPQAGSLSRWLEADPGSAPPADLDPEVLEAVYALRPERAPAPRVSVEDILGGVRAGPFATPEAMGELIAFPSPSEPPSLDEEDPEDPPANRGGWLAMVGGTSGIGLALVAAAALFVALPGVQSDAPPPAAVAPAGPVATTTAAPKEPTLQTRPIAAPAEAPARNARQDRDVPMKPMKPMAEPAQAPSEPIYDMDDGAALVTPQLIPELQGEGQQAIDLPSLRRNALPSDWRPEGWREGLNAQTLARVDTALEASRRAAEAGQPRAAAEALAPVISGPAVVAHAMALRAMDLYLQVGDRPAAIAAASQGLAFPENTPAHAQLLVRYGDLLQGTEPSRAAAMYRDAISLNLSR